MTKCTQKNRCCSFVAELVKITEDQRRIIQAQTTMIAMLQAGPIPRPPQLHVQVQKLALN